MPKQGRVEPSGVMPRPCDVCGALAGQRTKCVTCKQRMCDVCVGECGCPKPKPKRRVLSEDHGDDE